jgi:hypothetical protein
MFETLLARGEEKKEDTLKGKDRETEKQRENGQKRRKTVMYTAPFGPDTLPQHRWL